MTILQDRQLNGVCVMAIEAPYPSRNQSPWDNPLFIRRRLRQASRAAIIATVLALSTVGALAVTSFDSAQQQNGAYTQPENKAYRPPQSRTPVAHRSTVLIASFNVDGTP
jgi:hypothetical protein